MSLCEKKSTHRSEVVKVKLDPIEGTDNLALVKLFEGGHQVVCNKHQWKDGELGVYIVPDSVVNISKPEFSFLVRDANAAGEVRIKAKRMRGVWSEGLLVKAPVGSWEGDDLSEMLGVKRYEPPEPNTPGKGLYLGGEAAKPPEGIFPKYDVESWQRYKHLLVEGEEVIVTEKIHGANARFTFQNDTMYCGSRTEWKKEFSDFSHVTKDSLLSRGVSEEKATEILERLHSKKSPKNMWWKLHDSDPSIRAFCKRWQGYVLYGEAYGQVQDLKYGTKPGEVFFAAFDVWCLNKKCFLEYDDAQEMLHICHVTSAPLLYRGPYSEVKMRELVDGKTTLGGADHVREGIVIRPVKTRYDDRLGRVVLKYVSNCYLERSK